MGILAEIRQACLPLHQELEDTLNVTATVVNLENYTDLLQRFHSFLAPLEPILVAHPGLNKIDLTMASRTKVPALELDLRDLGVTKPRAPATDLPEVRSAAQAFGCLYVLEGSTLGGQLMARHFRQMPGVGEAVRYFYGYGPETGRRWKAFTQILGAQFDSAPVDLRREVTKSAESCFQKMGRALGHSPGKAEKRSTPFELPPP